MLDKHSNCNPLRLGLPLDTFKMVHISFSNVVHSILYSNLLLLIMNLTIRPESGLLFYFYVFIFNLFIIFVFF